VIPFLPSALVQLLQTYETELTAGAILTAEPWRVRVRPQRNASAATETRVRLILLTAGLLTAGARRISSAYG
jgi:hypothetical protein